MNRASSVRISMIYVSSIVNQLHILNSWNSVFHILKQSKVGSERFVYLSHDVMSSPLDARSITYASIATKSPNFSQCLNRQIQKTLGTFFMVNNYIFVNSLGVNWAVNTLTRSQLPALKNSAGISFLLPAESYFYFSFTEYRTYLQTKHVIGIPSFCSTSSFISRMNEK